MNDYSKLIISTEQARLFALSIYDSIADYVLSHQEEYQEFLRQEQREADEQKNIDLESIR